jgi:hypothetical protein
VPAELCPPPLFAELLEQNVNNTRTRISSFSFDTVLRCLATTDIVCITSHFHTVMDNKVESILRVVPSSLTSFIYHVMRCHVVWFTSSFKLCTVTEYLTQLQCDEILLWNVLIDLFFIILRIQLPVISSLAIFKRSFFQLRITYATSLVLLDCVTITQPPSLYVREHVEFFCRVFSVPNWLLRRHKILKIYCLTWNHWVLTL